jgi:hypothetical protein
VAQTTSDRCRMVSLWTAVERTWFVEKQNKQPRKKAWRTRTVFKKNQLEIQ